MHVITRINLGPSTELCRVDDLAARFDDGVLEPGFDRLDGDRVLGQDSHPDELRLDALVLCHDQESG
jgi:hypothetical protein